MKRSRLFVGLAALLALAAGLVMQGDVSAASLTARITWSLSGSYSNALDLGITGQASPAINRALDLASGVGASQADVLWSDQRTIAPSSTEDLDLKGGGLTDVFGNAINPAKVRAILVYAATTNTNDVVLGGDANSVPFLSTAATTVTLLPGASFVLTAPATAGIAVTAATGDIIQVANSGAGTSVTYDIVIIGTSS